MPELPEVEAYRALGERVVGRRVAEVVAPDAWYLKRGLTAAALTAAIEGRRLTAVRRTGKLLMYDTDDDGPVLGLRFGMSGRLVVDGAAGVDSLLYSSDQAVPPAQGAARALARYDRFDRFGLRFDNGGQLAIRDPRRLGGVELDPVEARLGPDALAIGPAALARALARSRAPLKARLLDQSRVAGVGNLAADEALWRAGLDPTRPSASLTPAELRRLHRHLRATMADLIARGGSHRGELMAERRPGGVCPRDGTPLLRRTVGGRTTWSCPRHQT